ncbi:MAG TPA: triose-phosphate isomerase [Candidatus Poseidoniales archaeon]|nr:triose-phosphate isomerase [Candidatus Poseidoniales archaeon]
MDERPIIVVNMKLHREAVEEQKAFIDAMIEVMERWPNVRLALATPAMSVAQACLQCQDTQVEIWTQHLDVDEWGSSTGSNSAAQARLLGAEGTLLNHAERPMSVTEAKGILEGEHRPATVCICAPEPEAAAEYARLGPEYLAVEPPELIGGDISVTTADPGIISSTVASVKNVAPDVMVLCGAGVKTGEDLRVALELGAGGVLLASGITKSKAPGTSLEDLMKGLT